ncbi:hypothetical protein C4J81_18920 (plasmid) [Deltaproteobacteria bacterium Smac51]|nr:hypothetical protein C4J81_18920 [Deltaproteobacteria bacterium Smac51]
MAKWWKTTKPAKKNTKSSPLAIHSMMLALEPRQVFDGAVGAAIADAFVDPNIDNHDNAPNGDDQTFIRTEGGAADQDTARGEQKDEGDKAQAAFRAGLVQALSGEDVSIEDGQFQDMINAGAISSIKGISVSGDGVLTLVITVTDKDDLLVGSFSSNAGWPGVSSIDKSTGSITITGTAEGINALLNTVNYTSGDPGRVTFTVEVHSGSSASGDPADSEIREVLVNDRPTIDSKDFESRVKENTVSNNDNNTESKLYFSGLKVSDRNVVSANDNDRLTAKLELSPLDGKTAVGKLYADAGLTGKGTDWDISSDGLTLEIIKPMTASEIEAIMSKIYFQGDYQVNGSMNLKLTVVDSFETESAAYTTTIDITPVNDPPEVTLPKDRDSYPSVYDNKTAQSSNSKVLTLEDFGLAKPNGEINDPDSLAAEIRITIQGLPANGVIKKGDIRLGEGATFSLAELIEGKISFEYTGQSIKYTYDAQGNATVDASTPDVSVIKFTVDDGGGAVTDNGAPFELKININPVNMEFTLSGADQEEGDTGPITLWVWERQEGANLYADGIRPEYVQPEGGLIFDGGDDDLQYITVTVKDLKLPEGGRLYLKIPNGDGTFTETLLSSDSVFTADKLQYLCYDATDDEPGDLTGDKRPSFKLHIADRQVPGGIKLPGYADDSKNDSLDATYTIIIETAPNNDDPTIKNNTGLGTGIGENNERPQLGDNGTADGYKGYIVTITKDMLQATDVDSNNKTLSYTIAGLPEKGYILYEKNGAHFKMAVGDSFTNEDIELGRVKFYCFIGGGDSFWDGKDADTYYDYNTSFKFTVRDGCVSSWPDTNREGGIYEWAGRDDNYTSNEGNPYEKGAALAEIEFDLQVALKKPIGGDSTTEFDKLVAPEVTVNNNAVPIIIEADDLLKEQAQAQGKDDDYYYSFNLNRQPPIIEINDTDTADEDILISLLENPSTGWLMIREGGDWRTLYVGEAFSYADLLADNVKYVHNGGEHFQDTLKFVVSDTYNYVYKDVNGQDIAIKINIRPHDDAPEVEVEDVYVPAEGGAVDLKDYLTLTDEDAPDSVRDKDADGYPIYNADGSGRGGADFKPDDLELEIMSLPDPKTGVLEFKDTDGIWKAVSVGDIFTQKQIADGDFLRYRHLGGEFFTDSFDVRAVDTSAEYNGPRAGETRTVTVNIAMTNDAPEVNNNTGIDRGSLDAGGALVDENGVIKIWGSENVKIPTDSTDPKAWESGWELVNPNRPTLYTRDPDNTADELTYTITKACEYGSLMRDGVVLGVGSTFTQKDINDGLLSYKSGKSTNNENSDKYTWSYHKDSFSFKVSDSSLYAQDGGGDTAEEHVFKIDVNPVNQQPEFGQGLEKNNTLYATDDNAVHICDSSITDDNDPLKFIQIKDPDWPAGYDGDVTHLYETVELDITAVIGKLFDTSGGLTEGSKYGSFSWKDGYVPTGLSVDVSETGTMKLVGSLEDINEALKHLTYLPDSGDGTVKDLNGRIDITFDFYDCNNGGEGNHSRTDGFDIHKTLNIYVSTQNNAPTANIAPGDLRLPDAIEDDNTHLTFKDGSGNWLQFTDVDSFEGMATVTISAVHGKVFFSGGKITGVQSTVTDSSGNLIITGTLAGINNAIKSVYYKSDLHFNGTDTISIVYDDKGNTGPEGAAGAKQLWSGETFTLTVKAANDAPTVDFNVKPNDHQQVPQGETEALPTLEIVAGNVADEKYEIDLSGRLTIDDPNDRKDPSDLSGNTEWSSWGAIKEKDITVTISSTELGTNTALGEFAAKTGSFLSDADTSVSGKITFTGTWAEIQADLNNLKFMVENPGKNVTADIRVEIDDQGNGSDPGVAHGLTTDDTRFLINVSIEANQAPIINVVDNPHVYEDLYGCDDTTGITLKDLLDPSGTGAIVADADSFNLEVEYRIAVDSGTLTYKGSSGQEFTGTATIAEINAMLAAMKFHPGANANGDVRLIISIDDKGHTGHLPSISEAAPPLDNAAAGSYIYVKDGVSLVTVRLIDVDVRAVNDQPQVTAGNKVEMNDVAEDTVMGPNDATGGTGGTGGQKVSDLFTDAYLTGKFTDPNDQGGQNGKFQGILITGDLSNPSTEGVWQYHNGTKWVDITNPSDTNAVYLSKNAYIRFNPVKDFYGEPGKLSVRLVENTGTEGVKAPYDDPSLGNIAYPAFLTNGAICAAGVNLSAGGTFGNVKDAYRPYTQNTVDIKIKIAPDYDAPVWGTPPVSYETNEESSTTLTGISFTDKDIIESNKGYSDFTLTVKVNCGAGANAGTDPGKLNIDTTKLPSGVSYVSGDGTTTVVFTGTLEGLNALLSAIGEASGKITYTPADNFYASGNDRPQVTFTIEDAGHDGSTTNASRNDPAEITVDITVKPVNDAPLVKDRTDAVNDYDGSGNQSLKDPFTNNPVLEDSGHDEASKAQIPTKTVEQIFSGSYDELDMRYGGNAPDVPGQYTFAGVVIYDNGATADQGEWQYKDANNQWRTITGVSEANGLFLAKGTEVRFVPKDDFNGETGKLKAYLADSTSSPALTTGGKVDVTDAKRGNITAFSEKHVAVGTKIQAVNDAPEWVANKPVTPLEVNEDAGTDAGNSGKTINDLFPSNDHFNDGKDAVTGGSTANSFNGVLITGPESGTDYGHWQYSTDNGANWTDVNLANGQAMYLSGTDSLRFVPAADYYGTPPSGTAGLNVHLVETSTDVSPPSAGTAVDMPEVGGDTIYSLEAKELTVTVKPVNDAPVIDGLSDTVDEILVDRSLPQGSQDANGWLVENLVKKDNLTDSHFTDPRDANHGDGSEADQLQGILITGTGSPLAVGDEGYIREAEGHWQYKLSGGAWQTFPDPLGESNAFYLPKDAMVRFVCQDASVDGIQQFDFLLVETGSSVFTDAGTYNIADGSTKTGGATQISDKDDGHMSVRVYVGDYNLNEPVITVPADGLTVWEDAEYTFKAGDLIFSDTDKDGKDNLTVTLKVENGTFTFSDDPTGKVTFSYGADNSTVIITGEPDLINKAIADNLTYKGKADYNGPDTISIEVTDTAGAAGITHTVNGELAIDVRPVNDRPTAPDGQNTYLDPVDRDSDSDDISGTKIENLMDGLMGDPKDAADSHAHPEFGDQTGKFQGILVVGDSSTADQGVWQYKDGNGQWRPITGVSDSSALYLAKDTEIRFVPEAGFEGQPGQLEVRLVENTPIAAPYQPKDGDDKTGDASGNTSGNTPFPQLVNGQSYDLTDSAGIFGDVPEANRPYTAEKVNITIFVNPVFDEDATAPVPSWSFSDPGGSGTYTVTVSVGQGSLTVRDDHPNLTVDGDGSGTLKITGSLSDLEALLDGGLDYTPEADYNGLVEINFSAANDAAPGKTVDSLKGSITIKPVNDAPELTGGDSVELPDFVNQPGAEPAGQTVEDLFGQFFSDARDQVEGNSGNGFRGILITGSEADPATEGVWQYYNGGSWVDISVSGESGALYLEASAELRFKPVTGFSGQPGGLTALLVETGDTVSGGSTGESLGNPTEFVGGETYDYASVYEKGGTSRVSGEPVHLGITIIAYVQNDTPPPILPENPSWTWQDNSYSSQNSPSSIPPWVMEDKHNPANPQFERAGLDAPHLRHGTGAGDDHQEINLITDIHISSVCWHTTEHIEASVGQSGLMTGLEHLGQPRIDLGQSDPGGYQWTYSDSGLPSLSLDRSEFAGHLGSEPTYFAAALADGSDLPDWLLFNPGSLTLTVVDPSQLTEPVAVLISARDEEGRLIALTINLTPDGQAKDKAAVPVAETDETSDEAREDMISDLRGRDLYLTEAAESFRNLWEVSRLQAEEADEMRRDADLNQKIELCAVDALLLEAKKLLAALS